MCNNHIPIAKQFLIQVHTYLLQGIVIVKIDHPTTQGGSTYMDGLEQDCSNSSSLAMELLNSCARPLICEVDTTEESVLC